MRTDRQLIFDHEIKKNYNLVEKSFLSYRVLLEPVDNGLVDGDILLTEKQAKYLIHQLNVKHKTKSKKGSRHKRYKNVILSKN